MGSHMGGHVVAGRVRGHGVTTSTGGAVRRWVQAGARAAGSVAECARGAEVLITMLPAPPQVEAVLLARRGDRCLGAWVARDRHEHELDGGGRACVAAARSRSIALLDAPVAGQSIGASAGTLAIYVGGSEGGVRARSAAVRDDGRPGADLAPRPQRHRLHGQAAAEFDVVHAGGGDRRGAERRRRAGVPLDKLHDALVDSPANSVFLERDVRMVLDDGDYDEGFAMRLVTKDLRLAVDLARDVGVPVELAALVEQIHARARAALRRRRR